MSLYVPLSISEESYEAVYKNSADMDGAERRAVPSATVDTYLEN